GSFDARPMSSGPRGRLRGHDDHRDPRRGRAGRRRTGTRPHADRGSVRASFLPHARRRPAARDRTERGGLRLLLEGRNAVIYGGGGSIGGAVARAFAREGATVHLAGSTQAKLDAVADAVRTAGGRAETAQLDALDERSVEALRRALSVELAPHGVRVVTLQTNGIAESISDPERRAAIEAGIVANTMLGRAASLDDVGNAAVFAASDWARTITASKINITCGGFVD